MVSAQFRSPAMQRSLVSGRTAAPAPKATRQAAHGASTRVVRAAASSASDSSSSPSPPLPLSSSTRREALALGAASLALALGSGVVATPSARAEEGGEGNGCELGTERNEGVHRHRVPPLRSKDTAGERDDSTSKPKKKTKKTEFTILYGTASPPTSYGGYGGNAQETAK